MNWYFVGVDLGQSSDFTGIAILERAEKTGEWDPVMYAWRKETELRLRFLERIPLGTPYPDVVARVVEITRSKELEGRCHLVVDGTGVGRPVVDLLRRARPGCVLMPVIITGGETEATGKGFYRVPKRDLITGMQVLLQRGALRIAAGLNNGPAFLSEMADMRVKVTAAGNEQYGAWRQGAHDDLVLAVALACWAVRRVYPNGPQGNSQWWRNEHEREMAKALRKVLG